jgi:hypothetical protein
MFRIDWPVCFSAKIAYNGLWLLRSVLFGVRSASLSQKYCNKIKQISTESYIAIFLFAETLFELQS